MLTLGTAQVDARHLAYLVFLTKLVFTNNYKSDTPMKLIIEESSLTLKLQNEDLISLRDKGMVQQETRFLSNDLVIFVDVQHVKDLQADFDEDGLQITIPANFLEQMKSSFKLGFKSKFRNLEITVEKEV